MNQVPYLGSYGYVAPAMPSPSFGKRLLCSPYFWLGLILFVLGAVVYNAARKIKEREEILAAERNRQIEDDNNQTKNGYGFGGI